MSEKDTQKDDLVGKTKAIRDHDHDMIHDLSKRLDAVWRYRPIHRERRQIPRSPAILAGEQADGDPDHRAVEGTHSRARPQGQLLSRGVTNRGAAPDGCPKR